MQIRLNVVASVAFVCGCASGGDPGTMAGPSATAGTMSSTAAGTTGTTGTTGGRGTTSSVGSGRPRTDDTSGGGTTPGSSRSTTDMNEGDGEAETDGGTSGGGSGAGSDDSALEGSGDTGDVRCGNGVQEANEECDGNDLGSGSCADIDVSFNAGSPACNADCELVEGSCRQVDDPLEVCNVLDTPPFAPLDIPDDGPPVSDVIVVDEGIGSVQSIEVRVILLHPYVGDLGVDLIKGESVATLWQQQCGRTAGADSNGGEFDVRFSEDAGAVECAGVGLGLSFAPSDPLTDFVDGDVDGEYELILQDFAAQDSGTLFEWCVRIDWEL